MASTTNVWKPAQGVQLVPIKMTKTVPSASKVVISDVKVGYRPPQARPKKNEPLDFGEQSFPSLGLSQAKPVVAASDFKGKIPYRTTSDRHYRLAKKAREKGKSINKIVDEAVEYYLNNEAV